MNPEYLDVKPDTWITKEYPADHIVDVNSLTEVYIVIYILERKGLDPEEIFTFTTDFEQAFKRFKLLPNTQGFLKRILTDDDNLIAIAKEGTKPKVSDDDPRLVIENKIEEIEELMDEAVISN
jgi:hypothetical protein